MSAPAKILELIARFREHEHDYKSGVYNETQLRRDFLDPFFGELGWDVDNHEGYSEHYREVIHEDRVRVGGILKAPDYGFQLGGKRKFFLEAKKPSIRIKDDVSPAYQLRRYAWSAKLTVSVLSNFEEFAVYDCRVKPAPNDPASTARLFHCDYTEYENNWEWISNIFSRDAVVNGSFDRYAASKKPKRGTAEVDADFLDTIEGWRSDLASDLARRNPALTQRELNFSVQCIVDRIIFLRICEDRGIEDYQRLNSTTNGPGIYPRLVELFRKADDRYNSGLFHFKGEKGRREPPDVLTTDLKVDDDLLRRLIRGLYYPESPYEFSVLTADMLGQVYEQFLGKVIHLSAKHRAVVVDKPEVKKAGGVYYTPTYIVDHIVQGTVGSLLLDKTPKQIARLRIVDPACGSGSFLIGAYQFLLDWYHRWYATNEPKKWAKGRAPALVAASGGGWLLTIAERKRILLAHIYGVDVDSQAVEVTKLSLLLKVLEGESTHTLQRELIHERVLPDLANNIKCGNSIIGPSIHGQSLLPSFDLETMMRINAFDWESAEGFSDILKSGGFDAVIGNPPYVDIKELPGEIKAELARTYQSATQRFDMYVPFTEKGLTLLSKQGKLGFILPSMFMRREYGEALRRTILELGRVEKVMDFGTNQIFHGPQNYVAIVILNKSNEDREVTIARFDRTGLSQPEITGAVEGRDTPGVTRFSIDRGAFTSNGPWQLLTVQESRLVERLFEAHTAFEGMVQFASEGIHSGKDEVFFLPVDRVAEWRLETPPVYPLAKGKDIHRYESADSKTYPQYVIYPYDLDSGSLFSPKDFQSMAPNTWKHLCASRNALRGRPYFEKSSKEWYELWCPRDPVLYTSPKIVGPEIANRGEFTISERTLFVNNKLKVIVLRLDVQESVSFVLGLLNSRLLTYLHRLIAPPKGNNYFEVKTRTLGRLPIRRINRLKKDDIAAHDRIVALVQQMLALNRQRSAIVIPHEKAAIDRQILSTDLLIDHAVYALYDLSQEEVSLVESCNA